MSRWGLVSGGAEAQVSFGGDGPRSVAALLVAAERVRAALPVVQPGRDHVALVFLHDRFAFAAALLGAWAAGHTVALPPNTRRDTVAQVIGRPEVVTMVHDTRAARGLRAADFVAADGTPVPLCQALLTVRPDRAAATLFTSGSSGAMVAAPKTFGQLLGEVRALSEAFPEAARARVIGTVSPTHIYGLLFTVLLPLATGGAFFAEIRQPFGPEALASAARSHQATVLVSVPVHLRACGALPAGALAPVRRVFSSAAPLDAQTAEMMAQRHQLPVTEVLGSTETGGIATRVQGQDPGYAPLPGVSVDVDAAGRLCVDSPFLHPAAPRPVVTADLAALRADGRILHRGRADGIVKVGGRRTSLRAMAEALMQQPSIRDAAVVAVDDPRRGARLLAAIASEEAWSAEDVRGALSDRFEPSTLPRRVATMETLPREANGKLQRARLLARFGLDAAGQQRITALIWGDDGPLPVDGVSAGHRFALRVPERYTWFDGHFPGYPVMAGVVQLHELVLPCVQRARPDLGRLVHLSRLKFTGRILPGDALSVELRWEPGTAAIGFAIRKPAGACATGRLTFEDATA